MSGFPKSVTLEELDRILERDPEYVNALLKLYGESQAENERLRAELQAYKANPTKALQEIGYHDVEQFYKDEE